MTKEFPELALFRRAVDRAGNLALSGQGGEYTYLQLLSAGARMALELLDGRPTLGGERVSLLANPGIDYVIGQWATWMAGGISVPLALSYPDPELRYVLQDAEVETLLVEPALMERIEASARDLEIRLLPCQAIPELDSEECAAPPVPGQPDALILYTSGTTGKPKGVVQTHAGVQAQIESLVEAWEWSSEDRILNLLPLHHTHGIVNILLCALWSGAVCEFLHPFDPARVWQRLASGQISLFMAVPTIYTRLIQYWEGLSSEAQESLKVQLGGVRLMVSGSAALPVPVFERWESISGHRLLERYGMTEIGMALSNPLRGERCPGTVGFPLPGVEVRLSDEQGEEISADSATGQIEVRGDTVFERYWRRPEETRQAFQGHWFQTGDIAERDAQGRYRILGRSSVDIIKTGGYKVSALEIEGVLLTHPQIRECAVVGIEDPEWGERVCVAVVCAPGTALELEEFRNWAKLHLAPYKVPSRLHLCAELPRNAMGKVTKPQVRHSFGPDSQG